MSEQNRHGKREAAPSRPSLRDYWSQHRDWVAGLSRGQRIRYRLFQVLVVICALIIALFLALRAWIRLPDVPGLPDFRPDSSQSGEEGLEYEGADLPEVAYSGRKDGYYTFLVAGQDVVSGSTDTMLLISYDTANKKIYAVSLLRDTMVNTSATRGAQKRLNVVYARNRGSSDLTDKERVENGMTALKQEVRKLTGIYPDFYVLVQWEAVGELVEAIGGVWFEVPFDMNYDDDTPGQDLHIHQEAGYRLLDGEDAMEVIRFRKGGGITLGDSGRTEIQRDFLVAVLKECLQPDVLLKLPELAKIFTENVDTDLSVGNILAFAQLAIGIDPDQDVTMESMPWIGASYDGASLVVANQNELLELLNAGINPYEEDIQAGDLQLMYQKSDGSFGVTNAALLDSNMARVPVVQPSEPDDAEDPETPDGSQDPDQPEGTEDPDSQTGTGDTSQSQTGGQTGQPENPDQGGGQTEPVLPGDEEEPGETGGGDAPDTDDPGFVEPVLPGDPSDLADIDPSEVFPAA